MCYSLVTLILIEITLISAEDNRGSLTFVIDRTNSMRKDIDKVKDSVQDIANTIFNKNMSQVQNMVLVTFDDTDVRQPDARLHKAADPDVPWWLVKTDTNFLVDTTNITEFIDSLNSIDLVVSNDCPEMSLKGLLLGLEKSRPESYVYVFTDDVPKEIVTFKNYTIQHEIVRIAQNHGHQIVFIISAQRICQNRYFYKNINPYYEIAAATSGQVFVVADKDKVEKVLDYVEETVSGSRTVITSKVITENVLETLNFTIDPLMEYAIISTSGKDVNLKFNTAIEFNNVTWINNAKVIKITKPGDYEVQVKGRGVTSIVIFGRTNFVFNYGFSEFQPEFFNETSKAPPREVQLYLSILVTENEGDVNITTAELRDIKNNVLLVPLKIFGEEKNFYVTDKFELLRETFVLSIIGQTSDNKTIRRSSRTPIDLSRILVNGSNVSPVVFINEGKELVVDFDNSLTLTCNVYAYPKPEVTWKHLESGNTFVNKVYTQKAPYQYLSKLAINHIRDNSTYSCEATNDNGNASATIQLYVKIRSYIKDLEFPEDATIQLGKEHKFVCKVHSFPEAKVVWLKNDEKLHDSNFLKISKSSKSLTIINMKPELEGSYSCEVSNDFETKIYRFEVILGLAPLVKNISVSKNEVEVGDTVVISCEVTGTPIPTVTWHFNNRSIDISRRFKILSNSLSFQVQLSDGGSYSCRASNIFSSHIGTTELIVYEKPTMEINSTVEKRFNDGSNARIRCPVSGGHPPPTVTWLRNNVETKHTNKIIRFDSIQRSDAGSYICNASNKYGSAAHEIQLIVDYSPILESNPNYLRIKIGESVNLPCVVKSSPPASCKWIRRESIIITNSSKYHIDEHNTLRFNATSTEVSGNYTCEATNEIGKGIQATYVDVLEAPKIEMKIKPSNIVREGEEVTIHYSISGEPKPEVKWFHDDVEIRKNFSKYIFIDNMYSGSHPTKYSLRFKAHIKDGGNYTCRVTNDCCTVEENRTITVYASVTIKPPKSSTINLMEGQNITLVCESDGYPIPSVKWRFCSTMEEDRGCTEDIHVDRTYPDGAIYMKDLSIYDSGHYECNASHLYDSKKLAYTVEVDAKVKIYNNDEDLPETVLGDFYLIIPCKFTGKPKPEVTWIWNSEAVALDNNTSLSSDGSLVIKHPTETISGYYHCRVCIIDDCDEGAPNTVAVLQAPEEVKLTSNYRIKKGNSFDIKCPVPEHKEISSNDYLRWYKDNKHYKDGKLRLNNVNYDNGGIYICRTSYWNTTESETAAVYVEIN